MPQHGGARRPNDRTPKAPGVGRSSKRTDTQLIATPNVQEGTDLQQGDRERIRQMQQTRRLGATPEQRVQPRAEASPALGPSGTRELPPFLADMPSTRPMEDEMTPAQGLMPDPDDDKEFVLQMLASAPWGNERVRAMLNDLRAERAQQTAPSPRPSPIVPTAPEEEEAVPMGVEQEAPLPEEDLEEEDFI